MVVSAVSLATYNPYYDISRIVSGGSAREQVSQQPPQAVPERVIQGEVISRAPLRRPETETTENAFSQRPYKGPDSGLGFAARNAVNTYIGQQAEGERIDRDRDGDTYRDSDRLVDVYV